MDLPKKIGYCFKFNKIRLALGMTRKVSRICSLNLFPKRLRYKTYWTEVVLMSEVYLEPC